MKEWKSVKERAVLPVSDASSDHETVIVDIFPPPAGPAVVVHSPEPVFRQVCVGRQPDVYDYHGESVTYVELAQCYRDEWEISGYPPGIAQRDDREVTA